MLTQGGPVFFDPVTEKFSPLTDDPSVQKLISREYAFETFLIDSRHRMWFAVGGGGIVCVNLSSSKVTQYLADSEKDTLTVGRYKTVHIFEDNKGDMYNSFDASINVQLSLISRHANKDDFLLCHGLSLHKLLQLLQVLVGIERNTLTFPSVTSRQNPACK